MNKSNSFTIVVNNITKRFNRFLVFKDLSFFIESGNSLSITGHNGSGKSTLLEVIGGIQGPTEGIIKYYNKKEEISITDFWNCIGFISPKINPYSELTGLENIEFVLRSYNKFDSEINDLLKRFDLFKDKDKSIKYYSSGMKQRLKFLLAILRNPHILLLDEPGSNLDRKGKDIIYSYLDSVKQEKILIIATNEIEEANLCNDRINLGH